MFIDWLLIVLFLLTIVIGTFILRKLKKQQQMMAIARTEAEALPLLKKLRHTAPDKQDHISFAAVNDWAEGKMDGEFLDRQLTGPWKHHVACCPECREMIEFFRAERHRKTMKELNKELRN